MKNRINLIILLVLSGWVYGYSQCYDRDGNYYDRDRYENDDHDRETRYGRYNSKDRAYRDGFTRSEIRELRADRLRLEMFIRDAYRDGRLSRREERQIREMEYRLAVKEDCFRNNAIRRRR